MEIIVTPQASHLDLESVELEPHPQNERLEFPDGEVYVQIELENVEEAVVVHSGAPEPDSGLMHLYGVLERLREEEIPSQVAFTYFPYGRQDREFFPGTLNRARAILRKLEDYYGVKQVYAVDAHFSHRDWVSEFDFENLESFPLIQDEVGMEEYVVVGPDTGAVERFGLEGFEKERRGAENVDLEGEVDVEGRNVLVFDDIIETGGTMAAAHEKLRGEGAERIEAAAVHGVLKEGVEKVRERYDTLHLTNTVDREASVSIEPLLRERLNL